MGKIFDFNQKFFNHTNFTVSSVKETARSIVLKSENLNQNEKIQLLLQATQCIDLTTLSGDDTCANVERLCWRALHPFAQKLSENLKLQDDFSTAAVCVYPSRVADCTDCFKKFGKALNIAAVATGFPSGQYSLETRLKEIEFAINSGAHEIDVVINRTLALEGDWKGVYNEIKEMRIICDKGNVHLKVILATGELGSLQNIYHASMAAMLAGADFIKTSTGKENVNATLPVGIVMTNAIWEFYYETGLRVGFKPAGGLKTATDAINWLVLMHSQLGLEWTRPDLFRIGASSLLNNLEKSLFQLAFKREPKHFELLL